MSTKTISFWVKVSVVAIALCGLMICGLLYPFGISLLSLGIPSHIKLPWMWLFFLWVVSVPCFVILAYAWKISADIKSDNIFTTKTAKRIKTCALILFADVGMLFLGNVILTAINTATFILLTYACFALVMTGLVVALLISILSHYVAKAALLREETEGMI